MKVWQDDQEQAVKKVILQSKSHEKKNERKKNTNINLKLSEIST